MKGDINELKGILATPCNVVITTHQRPDGDAMGSSMALFNYLIKFNHNVTVVTPTDYPEHFKWMNGSSDVLIYPDRKEEAAIAIENSDLIFCLDYNALHRIAPVDIDVTLSEAKKILIDHHLQPDEFDWMLSDTKACSTCELIYRFLHLIDENPEIDTNIANCLYTGLLTDTGGFQNAATNKASFQIAGSLLDMGLDMHYVLEQLHGNGTENKLRFLGNSLLNKMTIIYELGLAFIVVDKKDARTYSLQAGDTEGLVNYPLSIKGISIAVLIKEEKDIIKLSFRSIGDISVNDICRDNFEGGGHKNAAGGKTILPPKLAIIKITEVVEKYIKAKKNN